MSDVTSFTSDELDVLKEVTNIGMGQAGARLAEALGHLVGLRVPEVKVIKSEELRDALRPISDKFQAINVVRQAFFNDLKGEAILVFGGASYQCLVDILGYQAGDAEKKNLQSEMLLEISNSVNSACLQGFGSQIGFDIQLASPIEMGLNKSSWEFYDIAFGQKSLQWKTTLLLEVHFSIKEQDFFCEIMMFFSEDSLTKIHAALKQLLEIG